MGSNYLQGITDGFGLPSPLPAGVAQLASTIVDSYLQRPEGLLYIADNNGNPCAMAALSPSFTYTITGAVAAGTNVVVTVTPPLVRQDLVGEVLVLDYANPSLVEACVITSTTGNNQITLGSVQFNHVAATKADVDRVITEDRSCPAKRQIVRVAKFPIVNIVSLLGRYSYGRRSDQVGGLFQEMNLLASLQAFGGPPQWIPVTIPASSWSSSTGEIWVPASMYMAYFSDVRIKYVAGFATVPDPVVRATAQIALGLIQTPNLGGGLKMITAGDTRLERFAATTLDTDVKRLLDPFHARTTY